MTTGRGIWEVIAFPQVGKTYRDLRAGQQKLRFQARSKLKAHDHLITMDTLKPPLD